MNYFCSTLLSRTLLRISSYCSSYLSLKNSLLSMSSVRNLLKTFSTNMQPPTSSKRFSGSSRDLFAWKIFIFSSIFVTFTRVKHSRRRVSIWFTPCPGSLMLYVRISYAKGVEEVEDVAVGIEFILTKLSLSVGLPLMLM